MTKRHELRFRHGLAFGLLFGAATGFTLYFSEASARKANAIQIEELREQIEQQDDTLKTLKNRIDGQEARFGQFNLQFDERELERKQGRFFLLGYHKP